MKIVYSDRQTRHHGRGELNDGQIMPCFENPARVTHILDALEGEGFRDFTEPDSFGDEVLLKVHCPDYVAFLRSAWDLWTAERQGADGDVPDALPLIWPVRSLRNVRPEQIDGLLSYYSMDAGTPIMSGTWTAVRSGVDCVLTSHRLIADGARAVFCLTRPPGHHAARDVFGGYCYVNNAAVGAQAFLDAGAARVAILDVDYHHGNGTQAIFYDRADVLVVNIHADPKHEFPYFLGHADETGAGVGEGATVNLPLPFGTTWESYRDALDAACRRIGAFGPDALVVSYGFDTYHSDPISQFKLGTHDFERISTRIAKLGLPSLIVLEGGYAVDALGANVVSALNGF